MHSKIAHFQAIEHGLEAKLCTYNDDAIASMAPFSPATKIISNSMWKISLQMVSEEIHSKYLVFESKCMEDLYNLCACLADVSLMAASRPVPLLWHELRPFSGKSMLQIGSNRLFALQVRSNRLFPVEFSHQWPTYKLWPSINSVKFPYEASHQMRTLTFWLPFYWLKPCCDIIHSNGYRIDTNIRQ